MQNILNLFLDFLFKPALPKEFPGVLDKPNGKVFGGIAFEEIAKATEPAQYRKLTDEDFKSPYPVYNQKDSSACVSYAVTLFATIMYHLRTGIIVMFSPAVLYSKRFNKPGEGSYMGDIFGWAEKIGFIFEQLFPTDGISEAKANDLQLDTHLLNAADAFQLGKRIDAPVDFDTVVSIIEKTKKPLVILLRFGPKEWTDIPQVLSSSAPYGHAVVVKPIYGTYQGKQGVIIADSWGKFGKWKGHRFLTKEFFNKRVFWVSYCMTFKFDEGIGSKPSYRFDTASLQDCLVWEGVFPSNVTARGVYGQITIQAVKDFQKKYGLEQTGQVGPKTGDKLLELYP